MEQTHKVVTMIMAARNYTGLLMNTHHEKSILCKVKAAHGPPDEEEAFEQKRLFLTHETVEKDMENICKKKLKTFRRKLTTLQLDLFPELFV